MLLCLKLKLLPILLIEQSIMKKETFALVEFTKKCLILFFLTVSNKKTQAVFKKGGSTVQGHQEAMTCT